MRLKLFLAAFSVLVLFTSVPKSVAATSAATGKAFAVFVAAYNGSGAEARGGVCGTVFFVSRTQAITAYHVLQPKSFAPAPGFERVRVWLVHENEPAIEIKPEYLTYEPGSDLTRIQLPKAKAILPRFVFATGKAPVNATVSAEGFLANSVGPVLTREGKDLQIVSVPKLQRLYLEGTVVRTADVNMKSLDIEMKSAPCVQLSYKPIVGFSGGPVVANGKVIAMNSFADPDGRTKTWALRINGTPN